jgi:hypothetical protein
VLKTLGADVEVFARTRKGIPKSLVGLIGGTKEEPMPVLTQYGGGFAFQEDNVALEFNIASAKSENNFVNTIQLIRQAVTEKLNDCNLVLTKEASLVFPKEELQSAQAQTFGCEPDYNAWTRMENTKPVCDDPCLRTAGGHIHLGTDKHMINAIQTMDLYLGVPSVILDATPEAFRRKQLYGKAGAMRPKEYGCEYRVLSNFWIWDDNIVRWVFRRAQEACNLKPLSFTKRLSNDITNCINNNDEKLALQLIDRFQISMPA